MHNPENERIKRAYFIYLKEARRLGEHSIDSAAAALAKFEEYTKYRDFKRFHIQQAIGFKSRLSEHISPRTGQRLSRGTVFSTLNALACVLPVAQHAARLSIASDLRRRGVLRFVRQGGQDRQGHRRAARADHRPDPACAADHACRHRYRAAQSGRRGLHPAHRRTRWRHRLAQTQARRCRRGQGRAGCARSAHQVLEDVHDVVLPRGRGYSPDRCRLGAISRHPAAVWPDRSAVSCNPRSCRTSITCSRRAASRARIGPMPRRSGPSSRRRSPAPDWPTPIHTLFARRWPSSASAYAGHRRSSRPGARTSDTSRFSTTFSSYGQVGADRQAELIRHLAQRRETGTPKKEMIDRMIQALQEGRHILE